MIGFISKVRQLLHILLKHEISLCQSTPQNNYLKQKSLPRDSLMLFIYLKYDPALTLVHTYSHRQVHNLVLQCNKMD